MSSSTLANTRSPNENQAKKKNFFLFAHFENEPSECCVHFIIIQMMLIRTHASSSSFANVYFASEFQLAIR